MTVGIPGTGISWLFYLVAAFLLPVRGLFRRLRGRDVSWRFIAGKTALAAGVFLGVWLTGMLLGFFLSPAIRFVQTTTGLRPVNILRNESFVRWAALIGGFATLAFVLLSVQFARLLSRGK